MSNTATITATFDSMDVNVDDCATFWDAKVALLEISHECGMTLICEDMQHYADRHVSTMTVRSIRGQERTLTVTAR